ncbi:hypothetical protein BH09BAC4_BH09BAC4_05050 [soil metagenome]
MKVKKPPTRKNVKALITHKPFFSTPTAIPYELIINATNVLKQPINPLPSVLNKRSGADALTDAKLVNLNKAKSGKEATSSGR